MSIIHQTDLELIQEALPRLVLSRYATISDSRHDLWFHWKFGRWESFQQTVRSYVDSWKLGKNVLGVKPSDPESSLNYAFIEQYLCGDELSVSGRFAQNALSPVTAVARASGVGVRFGDFKTSRESKQAFSSTGSLPDYAGVEESVDRKGEVDYALRFVGEAKTPWAHNLTKFMANFETDKRAGNNPLRHTIGQIAAYMHDYDLKYGFLTTYAETIFLMQHYHKEANEYRLYVSDVIQGTHMPGNLSPQDSAFKTGSSVVSLRECLLYLVLATTRGREYKCKNSLDKSNWVQGRASENLKQLSSPFRDIPNYVTREARGQRPGDLASVDRLPPESDVVDIAFDPVTQRYTGTFILYTSDIQNILTSIPFVMIAGRVQTLRIANSGPTQIYQQPSPQSSPLAIRTRPSQTQDFQRPSPPTSLFDNPTPRDKTAGRPAAQAPTSDNEEERRKTRSGASFSVRPKKDRDSRKRE
ncbi:hypothetical protein FQN52_003084 [Onygenales sp. PD_12]|nr:hypothetical protein FQN52_003084 [Onygenales sp. PD_12]